ncbi:hypothetical protein NDU88_007583 [Pleurodeles waltl]|uniref:Uncharacterized protein n=1 Tax=Pleurodeles waltl TaxID=8319 RepID=A0AAV7NTQ0_PLEWA|nr:hypothetical protein NDU88_007583 [Pleurodeles waltl]
MPARHKQQRPSGDNNRRKKEEQWVRPRAGTQAVEARKSRKRKPAFRSSGNRPSGDTQPHPWMTVSEGPA